MHLIGPTDNIRVALADLYLQNTSMYSPLNQKTIKFYAVSHISNWTYNVWNIGLIVSQKE